MTSRDFCFWLQGFFERQNTTVLSQTQVEMIHRHLSLVFLHEIDPDMGDAKKQQELNKVHKPTGSHISSTVMRC
jgi:hypothetical protein